ncbi:MAG TPA: TadE family protein [Patescibacteria group bacterium]|nr:TadE family protein [Patescibacteria group bacterium]
MKRLWRNCRGTTAIEFALLGPYIIMLFLATLDIGRLMVIQTSLEAAARVASRYATTTTAQALATTTRDAQIQAQITAALDPWVNTSTLVITKLVYPAFNEIGQPEPYTDVGNVGHYVQGDPYTDVNGNGQWDADMGAAGDGGAGSIVVYKLSVNTTLWTPILFPLVSSSTGTNGVYTHTAQMVIQNEP